MKPKIYATGNERINGDYNISYYIVEKSEKFFDWLEKLLIEVIGVEGDKRNIKFWINDIYDENDNLVDQKIITKDIKKMIDFHEKYSKEENRIDLFYGKDRVYITFRKSRDTRNKFAKFLRKTTEWITIKKANNFPTNYNLKTN